MVLITCNAIGDIMSLAEFAFDIVKALDESRGSTAKYRELGGYIRSFSRVIECAVKAQENLQSQDQVAYTKALEEDMGEFRRALGGVSEIVQDYEHTLGGGVRGFRGIVAKLRWRFFAQSKIGPAKARVMECQSTITNIMVSNIVFKLNFPANVEDFNDRRDAILFTDVLGDTFSIPWYQCQSWEMFHEILCVLFKHKAGKAYVQSRSYEIAQIISENKSLTITPDTWSDTIDRGMKMEMSIVVRRYQEEHPSHARMITCHRCHKGMGKSRLREDEWMTCSYCSARIQADVQEESEETRNLDSASPDSNGDGANKQTSEGSRQTDGTERQGENEMTFFLRIRLMMRIQRRMDLPLEASPVASSQTFQGTVPTSRGFIETLLEKLFKAHPQSTPTRRRE